MQRKTLFSFALFFSLGALFFPQSGENHSVQGDEDASFLDSASSGSGKTDYMNVLVEIPEPKRPVPADPEKIAEAEEKDEGGKDRKSFSESLLFGTPSEISATVDKITENDDPRFLDNLYDLFYKTNSNEIRAKILEYFTKREDPCLEDFAVEVLDDPYDTSNSIVEKCFSYVSAVKTKAAAPALAKLLEQGEEAYFTGALSALGKTGGSDEAVYLAEYLERDDLTVPKRQALMRTLGQMNALETFDYLCEIAQDEDENGFVRMYAAEAVGNMKKEEAVPVLVSLFEKGDPNMRQYCIKGLKNFPENKNAADLILQGIRDDHYKVRIEAIKASTELNLSDAVPFIIYRSENDSENAVKKESYPAIAKLDTKDGNEFLVKQLKEKKVSDATKRMICEALMDNGTYGEEEIIALAKEALKDDRRKPLRNALGILFIKHARPAFAEIDVLYLQSDDATTVSQGLELYRNGRYEMARPSVMKIAGDSKAKGGNKNKARRILGLDDDEDSSSGSRESSSDKKPSPGDEK